MKVAELALDHGALPIPFKAKLSDKDATANARAQLGLPIAHVLIVPRDEELTWTDLATLQITKGMVFDLFERNSTKIRNHFLPELERPMGVQFGGNNEEAAARPNAHLHFYCGAKAYFGREGVLRRLVEDARSPGIIATEAVNALEQEAARKLIEGDTDQ